MSPIALRILLLMIIFSIPVASISQTYKLDGKVGDKFPIVVKLNLSDDGSIDGRYEYHSTLQRNGDVECSWLQIYPDPTNPYEQWIVRDCEGNIVETWFNPRLTSGNYLTARMINNKGKSYDIAATVVETLSDMQPLDSYLKMHIGEYAYDFNMFDYDRVRIRLIDLMGATNFMIFKSFYEVTVPLEYNHGMVWASGFKAHQCCDPATLWAYDTRSNSFYIWIRLDGQDYWWSESGTIPFEFRELVNMNF